MPTDPELARLLAEFAADGPDARERLYHHLEHLARDSVRRNRLTGELGQDALQEARLTLWEALERIDPDRLGAAAGMLWANVYRRPQKVAEAEQRRQRRQASLEAFPADALPGEARGPDGHVVTRVVTREAIAVLWGGGLQDQLAAQTLTWMLKGYEEVAIGRTAGLSRARASARMKRSQDRLGDLLRVTFLESGEALKLTDKTQRPPGRPKGSTRGRKYPVARGFHADPATIHLLQAEAQETGLSESEIIRRGIHLAARERAAAAGRKAVEDARPLAAIDLLPRRAA